MRNTAKKKIGWLRAVGRYYRDPSASIFGKLLALFAIVYVICPVDLIPDVPIIGWIDDLGVVTLTMAWLTRRIARYRDDDGADAPALDTAPNTAVATRRPFSVSP